MAKTRLTRKLCVNILNYGLKALPGRLSDVQLFGFLRKSAKQRAQLGGEVARSGIQH